MTRGASFVGRRKELAQLSEWARAAALGRSTTVLIRGESGIGKTTLIQELFRRVRDLDGHVTILAGRCFEREHVPYRAVDGLIDNLSQHWRGLAATDAAYLLPRDAHVLPRLFPVLARVPAIAEAPERAQDVSPQDLRLLALAALREVLHRSSRRALVVLSLDDMQWVDADTLALLRYLLHPPDPPPVFCVLSTRPPAGGALAVEALLDGMAAGSFHRLELEPLASAEAQQLAASLLGEPQSDAAADVAREAAGNPFFVERLARYAAQAQLPPTQLRLQMLVESEVQGLPETARSLIETVCLAGEPLARRVAVRAVGLDGEVADSCVTSLVQRRLLRTAGNDPAGIEAYHDRIRHAVVETIAPDTRQKRFRDLAPVLVTWEACSEELRARAWLGAGDRERAVIHARRAADAAVMDLAFEHAAKLYQHCLQIGDLKEPEQRELHTLAGNALANAGHGVAAATHYENAALHAPRDLSLELQFQAGTQLLHSGRIDDGIRRMAPMLAARGLPMPRSLGDALKTHLWTRAWLKLRHPRLRFRRRRPEDIPHRERQLLELCWSVFTGLMDVDPMRALSFHARHLRMSFACGELSHIVLALGAAGTREACFECDLVAARRFLDAAEHTAQEVGDDLFEAHAKLWSGIAMLHCGRTTEAAALLVTAERSLAEHGLEFAKLTKQMKLTLHVALYRLGRLSELRQRVDRGLQEAGQCGDLYLLSACGNGYPNAVWLAADDPDRAEAIAGDIMRRWTQSGFVLQNFFYLVARVHIALSRGDAFSAGRLLREAHAPLRRAGLLRPRVQHALHGELVAGAALAKAVRAPRSRAEHDATASKVARELEGIGLTWTLATAQAIRGQLAVLNGDDDAPPRLAAAISGFEDAGMAMHAAACRYLRGKLVAGDEGRAEIAAALEYFRHENVRAPETFIGMLVPALRALS